ncbi:aldehyde dehydrogenase family protein [Streptomyces sp. NPDC046805]|uniref:aldehyde dehydrogenase family protein n=1 Tax=Streptomyces sp. NPDC046805 TaxID=3155134 RepID=UPI0033F1E384
MSGTAQFDDMSKTLQAQRDAFLTDGTPSLEVRLDRLELLAALVRGNSRPIVETISADFGHRSPESTELTEVADVIGPIEINPAGEDLPASTRKLAPTLIIEPEQDALVPTEEIFGPLLPIRTYRDIDETIAYVNARPRPLGGVGPSGIGANRGRDGFRAFSHAKGVYVQTDQDVAHVGSAPAVRRGHPRSDRSSEAGLTRKGER